MALLTERVWQETNFFASLAGMKMRAAVLDAIGEVPKVREIDVAEPSGDEVLVKVAAAGICHSDLTAVTVGFGEPLPLVPGHEVAGEVVAVGPGVVGLTAGDHVVACEVEHCGYCTNCVRGRPQFCRNAASTHRAAADGPALSENGRSVHQMAHVGGFAEYMLVHRNVLARVPAEVPWDKAAVLGCAVATGAGAAINTAGVRVGDTVAVVGCGGVGLSAIQGAAIAGARRVIAVDINPAKTGLALKFGATHVVDASQADPVEAVKELAGGYGVDYALDTAGLPATEQQAYRMVAEGGTFLVVGIPRPGTRFDVDVLGDLMDLGRRGVAIRPVYMGSTNVKVDIGLYAELYLQGRFNLDDLVSGRVALGELDKGFELLRSGTVARAVITDFTR